MTSNKPYSILVHPYRSRIKGSCCYELGNPNSRNAIVFIGGLTDGPQTTPTLPSLSSRLEEAAELSYSLFEIRMRSAYSGFGTSSIANDVDDISEVVKYLRSIGRQKIILCGHSTGCQDCMEYANYTKYKNEPVDAFVLLAPVSDRESLDLVFSEHREKVKFAKQWIDEGKGKEVLPSHVVPAMLMGVPVTAYRLHSLCAKGGDDDLFSIDLGDDFRKRVWSRFEKPTLVLHCEKDEFVMPFVDQAAMNQKYRDINPVVSSLSGLIPGAGHSLVPQTEAFGWFVKTLLQFLEQA